MTESLGTVAEARDPGGGGRPGLGRNPLPPEAGKVAPCNAPGKGSVDTGQYLAWPSVKWDRVPRGSVGVRSEGVRTGAGVKKKGGGDSTFAKF